MRILLDIYFPRTLIIIYFHHIAVILRPYSLKLELVLIKLVPVPLFAFVILVEHYFKVQVHFVLVFLQGKVLILIGLLVGSILKGLYYLIFLVAFILFVIIVSLILFVIIFILILILFIISFFYTVPFRLVIDLVIDLLAIFVFIVIYSGLFIIFISLINLAALSDYLSLVIDMILFFFLCLIPEHHLFLFLRYTLGPDNLDVFDLSAFK